MMSDREEALKAFRPVKGILWQAKAYYEQQLQTARNPEITIDFAEKIAEFVDALKQIETIRAALSEPEWMPIAEAPEKGPSLIFVPGTGKGAIYVGWSGVNGRWLVFDTGRGENASVIPTHFMPLPSPPKGKTP